MVCISDMLERKRSMAARETNTLNPVMASQTPTPGVFLRADYFLASQSLTQTAAVPPLRDSVHP